MATIFSKIINGEIPCYKIHENSEFFAFLDINPLHEGHTLVVPKTDVDYLYDLEDDVLGRMIIFSKEIALSLKLAIPCVRIGLTVIGLEVPHAHIHLIPISDMDDMNFAKPKLKLSSERMAIIQTQILSHIQDK